MSPREENPRLMSSGEQRLIRTDGVKEVGAADFWEEEWIRGSHPNRQERTRRKLGGFRTSELVSLRSLKRFNERPISALLVIIPPQISAGSDLSQGKPDVLTGAGAPSSSSESILLASTCDAGSCWLLSSLQPAKIVLSSLCKYQSSSLSGVFFHTRSRHHHLPPLLWSSCCCTQARVSPGD